MLALSTIALPIVHAQKSQPPKQSMTTAFRRSNTASVLDRVGKVEKKTQGTDSYSLLSLGDVLPPQTTLRTGDDSAALLLLADGHYLRIGEKTVVVLNELGRGKGFSFKLLSGQVWGIVRNAPEKFEIRTPSSIISTTNALFGVGYDLETDQSMVSTGEGIVKVSLASGGWRGTVKDGQFVRYLRNPQPNIRLRAPEILAQDAGQQTMWKLLHSENWTKRALPNNNIAKLKRGQEKQLRQLTFSVSVDNK